MTYGEIINRIGDALGLDAVPQTLNVVLLRSLVDVSNDIVRKTQCTKNHTITDITTITRTADDIAKGIVSYTLPAGVFLLLDVQFLNTSGERYFVKEVTYETLIKWKPTTLNVTSFVNVFDEPVTMTGSIEDFDLGGYLAYSVVNIEGTMKVIWKPIVDSGSLVLYYVSLPAQTVSNLTYEPAFNKAFHSALVSGVVVARLTAKLLTSKSEAEFYAINGAISKHEKIYNEALASLAAYANTTVEVSLVEPFDFLNDPSMRL